MSLPRLRAAIAVPAVVATVLAVAVGPAASVLQARDTHDDAARVTTTDASTAIALLQPAGGSTTGPRPSVTGTGEPGDAITLAVDGTLQTAATIGHDGTFTVTLPHALRAGRHALTVDARDGAGNETSVTTVFTAHAG